MPESSRNEKFMQIPPLQSINKSDAVNVVLLPKVTLLLITLDVEPSAIFPAYVTCTSKGIPGESEFISKSNLFGDQYAPNLGVYV